MAMVRTKVRRRFFSYAAPVLAATVTVIASGAQEKPKPDPQKAAAPEFKDLDSFMKSLPAATVKPLDPQSALLFTALPLACLDDLQARPTARPYFWQPTYRTVENHDKVRAFYGCNDWSTAVNATWTIVTLLKKYPDLPVEGMIREKLTDHLGRQNSRVNWRTSGRPATSSVLTGTRGCFACSPSCQRGGRSDVVEEPRRVLQIASRRQAHHARRVAGADGHGDAALVYRSAARPAVRRRISLGGNVSSGG